MKDLISDSPTIQLIIVLGGIVTTWLTLKYKDRISTSMRRKQNPDRVEFIYDGYEGLIRQLKVQLDEALVVNERQHQEIMQMRRDADDLHKELRKSKQLNNDLLGRLSKYEAV